VSQFGIFGINGWLLADVKPSTPSKESLSFSVLLLPNERKPKTQH
jgi:hypothetical protein